MKFTKVFLSALCSLLLFAGCTSNNKAVITVNGEAITRGEYNEILNIIKNNPQFKNAPEAEKADNSPVMLMTKERIVQDLIVKKLLDQEYKKRKISANEAEIEAKKQEIIKQLGSEEKFNEILKANNVTEKRIKEDLANEVKVNKLVEATSDVKVSDKEVKDFYNDNKERFNYPERVKASHILIEANPELIKKSIIDADKDGKLSAADIDKKVKEAMDKKMALAKDIRAQAVANPKNFAELAKKYSDDKGSAQKGGDLGFFPREAMVKEFSDVAFSIKPDTISDIVVTRFGNHIIIVTDRAAAGLAPFEQVQGEIKAYLEQNKKIIALQKLFDGLKSNAKIEFNDPSFNPENIQKQLRGEVTKGSPNAQNMTPAK